MNEQTLELAKQAGISILYEYDGYDGHAAVANLSDIKKFAELIVKECCDKIEREYKYALGEKTQWAMSQDVQDLLKEHFGVE